MKISFFLFIVALILLSSVGMIFVPHISHAAGQIINISLPYFGQNPPLLSCAGLQCTSWCDIIETLKRFLYFGMTLALFVVAPVIIVYGGIMIMIAGGSSQRLETGKKAIYGTAVGIALVMGSFLIVSTITKALVNPGSPLATWSSFQCTPGTTVPPDIKTQ